MVRSIIRKSDIVANVPKRWLSQYKDYKDRGDRWDKAPTTAKLLDLKPGFTTQQVNDIIGNESWTKNECDECGNDCSTLIRIGQEPDYEARWLDICHECLSSSIEELEKADGT